MKRIFIVFILLISMLFAMTGCSLNENRAKSNVGKNDNSQTSNQKEYMDKKVTLKIAWWGSDARAEKTKNAIELFRKKYPNVTIETEYSDFKKYWEKMTAYSLSGELPDIMQQDYAYIGQYTSNKTLEDLTPYMVNKTINTEDVNVEAILAGKIDGKVRGIALGINSQDVIYDPEAFKKANVEPPANDWTWESYKTKVMELYRKGGFKSGLPYIEDPKILIEYWVRSAGRSLYNKSGTSLGFDDPKLLESLYAQLQGLIKTGAIYDIVAELNMKNTTGKGIMSTGATVTHFTWSNLAVMEQEDSKKNLSLCSLPKAPSGDNKGMYLKPSMFFSISKTSKEKDMAAKFIDFFINDIEANRILSADRGIPVSAKIRNDLKNVLTGMPKQTMDYIDSISDLVSPIDPPEPQGAKDVTKLAADINNEVIFMKTTPDEAAKKFITKANEILAKNKK